MKYEHVTYTEVMGRQVCVRRNEYGWYWGFVAEGPLRNLCAFARSSDKAVAALERAVYNCEQYGTDGAYSEPPFALGGRALSRKKRVKVRA